MKICSRCKQSKPLAEFGVDKRRPDGLRNNCKQCASQEARESYQRNLEKRRACSREWMAKWRAIPGNAEKNLAACKAWYSDPANAEISMARTRAWAAANPERKRENDQRYKIENAEKFKASQKAYRTAHKEQLLVGKKEWKRMHSSTLRQKNRIYRLSNLEKFAAKEARRRALKFQAIPSWANEFFIEEAYDIARRRTDVTGIEWHVDHIVPLNSKLVCGLHVENNLAVIIGIQNISKSNRYWPDMP